MTVIKQLPSSHSDIFGIIGVNWDNIKYKVECNTDVQYCPFLFLHTQPSTTIWGISNRNDWVKISFPNSLLYLTNYSLQASPNNYRAKGMIIEGELSNGKTEIVDDTSDTELNTAFAVSTKEVNKAGPYKSLKFSINDTYSSCDEWYSSLFGIDMFGILTPNVRCTCRTRYTRFHMENIIFIVLVY